MRNRSLYSDWELSRPNLSGRSYFYSLPPIGLDTPHVESLTGYIARLAAAHAVETGDLVNHELLPRVPYTKGPRTGQTPVRLPRYSFYFSAHALNGPGERARLWISLLEELTRVPRLDVLTFGPWSKMISGVCLLRPYRAWCSLCYELWRSLGQSVYEPLLWTVQSVEICPEHRQPLDTVCHSCGRRQYVFSSRSRPGYCSRCRCWLGRESPSVEISAESSKLIRTAAMVGELLAASSSLAVGLELDLFRANVGHYMRSMSSTPGMSPAARSSMRGWSRKTNVPRLTSVCELSHGYNVSILQLLTEPLDSPSSRDQKPASKSHPRVADSVVKALLQTALETAHPPSLQEIANQLGYRAVASVKRRCPQHCAAIASRRRTERITPRPKSARTPVPRARIEEALIEELNKPGFTDLKALAATVGLSSKRRLYKDFRDLRLAIVAKNARFVRQRQRRSVPQDSFRAAIENALRAAFEEQPVPTVTEVAMRFGFATVKPITSRFPELTKSLMSCRRNLRRAEQDRRVREQVRQILTDALTESPPPSCAELFRRIDCHKTRWWNTFPDQWAAVRSRHVEYQREVRRSKRQAFAEDAARAVAKLQKQGVYPSCKSVLANISEPRFRCVDILSEAICLARLAPLNRAVRVD